MIVRLALQWRPLELVLESHWDGVFEVDDDSEAAEADYTSADVADVVGQVNEFSGLWANKRMGFK